MAFLMTPEGIGAKTVAFPFGGQNVIVKMKKFNQKVTATRECYLEKKKKSKVRIKLKKKN